MTQVTHKNEIAEMFYFCHRNGVFYNQTVRVITVDKCVEKSKSAYLLTGCICHSFPNTEHSMFSRNNWILVLKIETFFDNFRFIIYNLTDYVLHKSPTIYCNGTFKIILKYLP